MEIYTFSLLDYVSKWVKAFSYPGNDANIVVGFIQRNILSRYGDPKTIISDEGSYFANKLFVKLLSRYEVRHAMILAYHPQSNGQAELSNREINNILEKIGNTSRKDWLVKIDGALWAYRTAYKSPIGMLITTQIVLFFILINTGFEHFLCTNKPN